MTAVDLARLQFALTAGVHFLFVGLTLGLVTLLVVLQTRWWVTGDPLYGRMTRFWGVLYLINYALGIATGLVMEFQFGLGWTGVATVFGDVFGAPLALETLIAFFLESTLLGLWIFGWGRLRRGVHTAVLWGVAVTAYLSAFWIMVANSFLQHPVGYAMDAGRARLVDFGALLANPNLWFALAHVVSAALLIGGLFMAGVSAWHFVRGTSEVDFFRRSLRLGVWTALIASNMTVGFGFAQFSYLSQTQPTKLGGAEAQADFVARFGPGEYLPPAWVGASLGFMVLLGQALWLVTLVLAPLLYRDVLIRVRALRPVLWGMVLLPPLPLLITLLGWLVREGGRQPWVIYGVLRTSDAAAKLSTGAVQASLIGFTLVVGGLAVLDWYLLARFARRGPGRELVSGEAM